MRIFSGIRPTGELHIGNYLGAIKQWIELQEKNECFFCIVDWHAITTPYDPNKLQKDVTDIAIAYLAAGLNPEKCVFFVQSQVKEHAELAWLLGAVTPIGELQRMTQYKEKARKYPKNINAGLLNYPILMAADILLYQTDAVPVGQDQKQHIELTQTLARKFNNQFGKTFKEPEAIIPKSGSKIMSLQNPKKKMSKTDERQSYIGLFDAPQEINKKIMSAVTDAGSEIKYNPAKKPGISNLLTIYSLFSGKAIGELEKMFAGKGYSAFKKSLAETVINGLEPFRRKKTEYLTREVYVKEILSQGAKRAGVIAASNMQEIRKRMGLS